MPSLPTAPVPGRLPSLDGLRAVSVLMVMFGHAYNSIGEDQTVLRATLVALLGNSGLGVMVFFVISGYLITHLLRREQARTGRIDLLGFYGRRVARIFPVFFLYLAVIAVLTAAGILAVQGTELLTAGTFLWNYGHLWRPPPSPDVWYVCHFWTLALEEQFYLAWPLALLLVGLRRGAGIALTLFLLMPPIRVAMYFLCPDSRGQLGMMLHTASDPLMCGCLLALWEGSPRFERIARWLAHGVVPVAACVSLFIVTPYLSTHVRGFGVIAGTSLDCVAIALVMLWLVRHPDSRVGRCFNLRPVVHLGVLSYSLYIWQQLFLAPEAHQQWVPFPLNLLMCLVAAELSYHLVERPILVWYRKRSATRASSASPLPTNPAAAAQRTGTPEPTEVAGR